MDENVTGGMLSPWYALVRSSSRKSNEFLVVFRAGVGSVAWQAAQALERETIAQHEELGRMHLRLNELEVREDRLASAASVNGCRGRQCLHRSTLAILVPRFWCVHVTYCNS